MPRPALQGLQSQQQGAVLTKAVLRAADLLGIASSTLGKILGISPASVSRMRTGDYLLDGAAPKAFELGVLFVRLFRSLDAIAGGDTSVARTWLSNHNTALDARPIDTIQSITGMTDVVNYLDARRADV